MGNISQLDETVTEKARRLYGLQKDEFEIKIGKLKDESLLRALHERAYQKDNADYKKIILKRGKELGLSFQ